MISDKQKAVLAFPYSRYKHLICDGAIRSGKSSFMSVAFVEWAMREYSGHNFIIMGYTIGTVLRNVIDPLLAMAYMRRRYKMKYLVSKGALIVERGGVRNNFLIFGADTERSFEKVQGLTAAGCLIDEVALCVRSAVEQAMARCSVTGSRYWFNCNPDNPKHWFYTDWILQAEKHKALHLHFTMDDNPSLDDEVKERFNNQYHGVFHDRYIKGLWRIAEGLVYQFDSEDEYTISNEQIDSIIDPKSKEYKRGEWYISIDYGITNPFAAGLWYVTSDVAYMVDEYYFASREEGRRKTDSEHYASVKTLAGKRPIEGIVIDPSATSFKEEIWRDGRFDVWDANNDVLEGIQVTDQMLHDGSVKIAKRCTNMIDEMGLYRWDDKAAKDQVIKENDHCADQLRYITNTILKYQLKSYQ